MKIFDLPAPVTASKADWLTATTWLGFTPTDGSTASREKCRATINRQFGRGYVIEYITSKFGDPNEGFADDPSYRQDLAEHAEVAGRFIAVHKLRASPRPLVEILGQSEFERLQDMWANEGKRFRWSVAFPIIESYRIVNPPKANEVLGPDAMQRLFGHPSATLRPLDDNERNAIADLELVRTPAAAAWIAIEDEIRMAEGSALNRRIVRLIDEDLGDTAMEGFKEERKAKIRKRAAWLANRFVIHRSKSNSLLCDECGFDPVSRVDPLRIKPRSILDVHHRSPLEEGVRYTTIADFALLCPTCHRIEHARLRVERVP